MKREIRRILRDTFMNTLASSVVIPNRWRWRIYRLFGLKFQSCLIAPRVFFGGNRINIGRGSFLNYGCFIDSSARVTIGDRVSVGMGTYIITSSHNIGATTQRAGEEVAHEVVIGDGSWLGARVTILPGVTLGGGCIVGAGALVTKSWPANSRIAGVPAKALAAVHSADGSFPR